MIGFECISDISSLNYSKICPPPMGHSIVVFTQRCHTSCIIMPIHGCDHFGTCHKAYCFKLLALERASVVFGKMIPLNTLDLTIQADINLLILKLLYCIGSLMIISWLLLSSSGIFFAMWMKPVFANGMWFQLHRGLMIAGVVTEVAGFICIFVATKDNKIPGLIGFECVSNYIFTVLV